MSETAQTDPPATQRKRAAAPKKGTAAAGRGVAPGPYEDADLPPDHTPIDASQMRHLHALLRDHGITGDKARHDYLSAALGRPVESASEVSKVEGAKLIHELETAPVARVAGAQRLEELRAPFPSEAIGKLPRSLCKNCSDNRGSCTEHPRKATCQTCGNYHNTQATMHIDFVGHADVTARLLAVDPEWSWEPFTAAEVSALPPTMRDAGLWIHLTVLGVTRPGFGDADGKRGGNAVKEMIGDALRNAAMRFGVALDLWAKGDREWAHAEKAGTDQHPDQPQPREPAAEQRSEKWYGPTTEELLGMIDAHAGRAGVTYEQITAKWRETNGGLTVDDLEQVEPQRLAELESSIARYLQEHPPQPAQEPVG